MKTLFGLLAAVMMVAAVGCTDTLTEPGSSAIIGEWKASKVGEEFQPASSLTIEFKSNGTFTMDVDGSSVSGTYSTAGASASSTIRDITINATSPANATMKGIYQINGSQMKLEVVTYPTVTGVVLPDAALGMGSTTVNGSKTNDYITELQKQ
jgi:hypothetical protein